jgi:GTP-binding protein EngB required for normal cell division
MSSIFYSQAALEDALLRCREVAKTEYCVADNALGSTKKSAKLLCKKMKSIIQEGSFAQSNEEGMQAVIHKVSEQLSYQVDNLIVGTRRKLTAKKPRLKKFTIALFGRTMAGKSTFREAITGGNGASIGKGAQNTTKRVHEYEWRGIHIIDTPGIGSFQGEHYRQQAISAVGKSDLVLFLLSDDGIQQEVFEGMRDVLLEYKPVFFVLNVKRDLTKDIYRERFLNNPASLLGHERIAGHFRRIQTLAVDTLGSKNPRVFVVHAQAAHLSTQKHVQADSLYRASRMEELHAAICEEVSTNGPIRRLQTLLDGTIGAIDGLSNFYAAQASRLKNDASFFNGRLEDFELRTSQFLKDQTHHITAHVAECFQGLHIQVFDFIEENIERKDIGEQWQRRVNAARVEENLKSVQERVLEAAKAFLAEFTREIAVDSEFVKNLSSELNPKHADVWDLRRGFGRTAAAATVLSAVAFLAAEIGAANIWNPVGWVLVGVSIVAGIFAWLIGKKADRLAKEKEKACQQLHDQIHAQEGKLREALLNWLQEQVKAKALNGIASDLRFTVDSMKSLEVSLQAATRAARIQVDRLNARLLLRLAEVNNISTESIELKKLARSRGLVFRALCSPGGENVALSKLASASLGENVSIVPNGPAEQIIRKSLRPVKPKQLEKKGRGFVVHLTKRQMRSFGRMADALLAATRRIAKAPTKFIITG